MSKRKRFLTHHLSPITYHCLYPSADEVNDLKAVAVVDDGLRPVGAADDPSIEFDGEAFGRERQMADELGESDGVWNVARFAVDLYEQVFRSRTSGLMDDAAQFGSVLSGRSVDENGRAPRSKVRQHRVEGRNPVRPSLPRKDERPEARP